MLSYLEGSATEGAVLCTYAGFAGPVRPQIRVPLFVDRPLEDGKVERTPLEHGTRLFVRLNPAGDADHPAVRLTDIDGEGAELQPGQYAEVKALPFLQQGRDRQIRIETQNDDGTWHEPGTPVRFDWWVCMAPEEVGAITEPEVVSIASTKLRKLKMAHVFCGDYDGVVYGTHRRFYPRRAHCIVGLLHPHYEQLHETRVLCMEIVEDVHVRVSQVGGGAGGDPFPDMFARRGQVVCFPLWTMHITAEVELNVRNAAGMWEFPYPGVKVRFWYVSYTV